MLYITIDIAEVLIPKNVLIESPKRQALSTLEPTPAPIVSKAPIIPNTVPNNPIKVPIETNVAIILSFV